MSTVTTVMFLGFPNVGEQDLMAPWELFRSLALTMGQLSFHGEDLFSLVGPVLVDDAAVTGTLQDSWENVFLPA